MKRIAILSALLCVSCATLEQPFLRIELEDRAKNIVNPQIVCAEQKARYIDNCFENEQSVALNLSMHCRHEYDKATEDYARSFFDNKEEQELFREKRNNIQEKIEAFLPIVIYNRTRTGSLCTTWPANDR
ncbi:MAG: hypothetical protein LBE22_00165 [Azoarcus sp.]|jgi:hypothetical protein|nr:hypothetical protein [Azoarcus sp.]